MKLITNNMQQQEINISGIQITPEIPSKIYLDMTPDCNLHCIMCRQLIENSGRIMEYDLFKRIVDETCEGITNYSLSLSGESLLLPDFRERIKYVAKQKLSNAVIELLTNGMLLDEDTGRFLIDYDVEVHVSFDGSNAHLFEKIRRGSNFNNICRNLERVSGTASHLNSFRAPGIGVSIQKDNWHDLVNIIVKANDLGVRKVSMWPVIDPEPYRLIPNRETVDKIAEAIRYADSRGMAVTMYPVRLGNYIWNGDRYIDIGDSYVIQKCNAPFSCSVISWNGDVYLCCNYGDKVENINGRSFYNVWMGNNYKRLRRQVNDESNMPERCQKCFWVNRY